MKLIVVQNYSNYNQLHQLRLLLKGLAVQSHYCLLEDHLQLHRTMMMNNIRYQHLRYRQVMHC